MNILIVDGNEKKASDSYTKCGMSTQYDLYKDVLKKLLNEECNILTIHPAIYKNYIPVGISLDDFQGIVWTGSLLNIYQSGPAIERQIELAKELFKKKNKIFGSCWGLQVLTTAAGGSVRKNPLGLEAVIASDITLNEYGTSHPMYLDKPKKFDSFCWHYDEIDKLPLDAKVLSFNKKSLIQSVSFLRNQSEVWAAQYHPEFDSKWISDLMHQRKSLLLEEGIYESCDEFDELCSYLSDNRKFDYLKNKLCISDTLINKKIHSIELSNWLKSFKSDN